MVTFVHNRKSGRGKPMSHPVGNRLPRSASRRIIDSTTRWFNFCFFVPTSFWLSFRCVNIPPLRCFLLSR
ncbi:Uncharacterized protein APZ42_021483 [Daphnia magna]|uniref:Uncharacterized protein n=1 Tax=Daphnia magna TaxID=35525 RepID=A0A164WMA3_9CRUS|nr:Uncharacterized protein APZ42_021483 [Daphnia magna]